MTKPPFLTMGYAGAAGFQAAISGMYFIEHATKQAAVLQAYLSRAPELTDKVIEAANKAAGQLSGDDAFKGIVYATGAGIAAGLALYEATRKE